MTTETMTVHKALAELKIIDERIHKAINSSEFIVTHKKSESKINGVPVKEFEKSMIANMQKVKDLINRRDAMKRAVVLSNAITEIDVMGKKYTVAEAIDMKNNGIDMRKALLESMAWGYNRALSMYNECSGKQLEEKANEYVQKILMSQGTNTEMSTPTQIQALHDSFVMNNEVEILDPNNIDEKMAELDTFIDDFNTELDSALSVSNALTTITFEY